MSGMACGPCLFYKKCRASGSPTYPRLSTYFGSSLKLPFGSETYSQPPSDVCCRRCLPRPSSLRRYPSIERTQQTAKTNCSMLKPASTTNSNWQPPPELSKKALDNHAVTLGKQIVLMRMKQADEAGNIRIHGRFDWGTRMCTNTKRT